MNVIQKLYKEVFSLISFGTPPKDVFNTIVGGGMIIYGYGGEDADMEPVRDFIRKYHTGYTDIHPVIAQLYFLHFKHNLNILDSLPETPLSYDAERMLPMYSYWVDIPGVVSFYRRFTPKKFTNSIKLGSSGVS